MVRLRIALVFLLLTSLACGRLGQGDPIDTASLGPFEGDDPGECSDGADNDRDDYFDCDDSDCFGSPDCEESDADADADTDADTDADADADTDADTDADADADTDTDTDADQESVTVSYVLDWDINESRWGSYGFYDCQQTYSGSGTVVETDGLRVTFYGPWNMDSSDCSEDLDTTVWHDAEAEEGFTTLYLSSDLTEIDAWIVHEDLENFTPDGEPSDKFYIYDMEAVISDNTATYQEDEEVIIHGFDFATLSHDLELIVE